MANSNETSSAAKTWLTVLIGLGLMVLGGWYSGQPQPEFIHKLEEQGIPLNPGATVAAIGVLLILFPIVRIFFVTPLQQAIQTRTTDLERTFAEAEELRSEMTRMRSDYEKRLAETEAQAREQIQAQIREAQNLRADLMAEATSKADSMVKRAQEEIEQQKNRALTEMRLEVVNLTLAATERVLGENIDDARNRKLVEEFIDKVEVPS